MTDGYKAVQSIHAAINFTFEHPDRAGPWFRNSNYLVLLEVENENKLKHLIRRCQQLNLAYSVFREPDIGNEITALAIEPSKVSRKLVSNLPLLFKSKIKQNETAENSLKNTGNESQSSQLHQERTL